MKTFLTVLLMSSCLSFIPTYAQQQDTIKVKSIEEAINTTLKSFRKRIVNEDAIVYCILKNQLNMKDVDFNEKNLLVENSVNAKYIDRKTPKYLLTFHISERSGTIVDVSMSTLVKKTRRKIEYTVHSYAIPITYRIVSY